MDEDYTVINSMVPGGPAAKSKRISVGDRIVGVGQAGKPMVDDHGVWMTGGVDQRAERQQGASGSAACRQGTKTANHYPDS
ncbi:PDZ domain-containing protein [Dickeya fangzhongdai]|nr:PDZ domain-containing protein [Dickeya fangzhongdai]